MYFEDFEIDRPIESRSRIVTGTDIDLFASLTGAVNPLFLSDERAQQIGRKARLTPGPLLFSYAIGLCYQTGTFDQVISLAGVKEMTFLTPVHPGDMLTTTATPVEKRSSKKEDQGLVVLRHELKNQNEEIVLQAEATYLVRRKPT